jgi:rfaE bifunctional protein nucleotidyltransferase chain/domain
MSKIVSKNEIGKIVTDLRKKNPNIKIVTTNGAFDILHSGHLYSLEEAKKQGDILIVGLNSDKSVKEYKSKNRPIISENERAKMLAGLKCVNFIVIFDETNPIDFLSHIRPDVHVKSKEGYKGIEKDVVEGNGGKLFLIEDKPGLFSTTKIIEKIKYLIEIGEL